MLALITNRSFIESRTFDGFRKVVEKEFSEIRIVDLGGDVRANPKLSGTRHNVFRIQTGVAISFLVRRAKHQGCRIFYVRRPELEIAEDKLAFLNKAEINALPFEEIRPDAKGNWINQVQNDFDTLAPIGTQDAKTNVRPKRDRAIFNLFSLGINTARDEWLYDFDTAALKERYGYLVGRYNAQGTADEEYDVTFKWSEALKLRLRAGKKAMHADGLIRDVLYRPYILCKFYDAPLFVDRRGSADEVFPVPRQDSAFGPRAICMIGVSTPKPFAVLATAYLPDLHLIGGGAGASYFSLYRFDARGHRLENIADSALEEFRKYYEPGRGKKRRPVTKEAIFHYVYAVLHDPIYREKYALNLRREFPRIPFYPDFWQWADWGKTLMDWHIGYECVEPFELKRIDINDERACTAGLAPKAMLKADKEQGRIVLDSETTLSGVPPAAWDYKLGNRCALEWILDQYKEKTPKHPTIREKFNTYRFADYKDKVIDLLTRVTTVSIETQRIVEAMRTAQRA